MNGGLTRDERLAVLVAMEKVLETQVEEAKAEARDDLVAEFARTYSKSRPLFAGGEQVGKVSVKIADAKPQIAAGREAEAMEYLRKRKLTEERPAKGWERRVAVEGGHVLDPVTGEVLGFFVAVPPKVTAAVTGCEPGKVAQALGPALSGQTVAGLLAGRE